jgi:membrane-associated protease RseP (regulator of RpoE activity)
LPFDEQTPELPRPKFQHRYWVHALLFLLTLFTTTYVTQLFGLGGWSYSIPILTILGAHEFGHYFYCRKYGVDASLPYFLPAPFPLTGTLGAVIRIRQAFPSKAALFDIAVAGPIAGFIALLPFLYVSFRYQTTAQIDPNTAIVFGEPLLFKLMSFLWFGPLPAGFDETISPMGMAAWVGMLATALNLLPFGQLDGGHVAYALFGRRAWIVSLVTLSVTLLLTIRSRAYFLTAVTMLVMAYFLGLRHPAVPDSEAPLDRGRKAIAILVLVIFVLCFTPVPIVSVFGQ